MQFAGDKESHRLGERLFQGSRASLQRPPTSIFTPRGSQTDFMQSMGGSWLFRPRAFSLNTAVQTQLTKLAEKLLPK